MGQDEHLDKERIRRAVRMMASDLFPAQPFAWAKVKSVDKDEKTAVCTDMVSQLEYFDVLLGLGSIIGVPVKDTTVLLGLTSQMGEASFIIYAAEVEEYFIVTKNGFKVWLKTDGTMEINGKNLDGLAVVGKMAEKLNAIENAFNQHVAEYNKHIHPVSGTATLVPAVLSTLNLNKTNKSDLENNKIKHGD